MRSLSFGMMMMMMMPSHLSIGRVLKISAECKCVYEGFSSVQVYPPGETDPYLTREPRELVDGKKVTYDSAEVIQS